MFVFSTSFVWAFWFDSVSRSSASASVASARQHRQDILSQRGSERVTKSWISVLVRCIAATYCYNKSILSILSFFCHTCTDFVFFKDVWHKKCVCVFVCFLSLLCCDARLGVTEGKIKALQIGLLGFLVSSYESEKYHRIFTRIAAEIWYLHLVKRASPRFFQPPSLWTTRTRTALMWRSDPGRTR